MKQLDLFLRRHQDDSREKEQCMLDLLGVKSLNDLIREVFPENILQADGSFRLTALNEHEVLKSLAIYAAQNKKIKSLIGLGYHATRLPSVIQRSVLENPAWYTAYTPYQAEISQGRLEILFHFQTLVCELSGMEIANASLLDEATAAAEAMALFHRYRKGPKRKVENFLLDKNVLPQTLAVLKTRADALGLSLTSFNPVKGIPANVDAFGLLLQQPGANGEIFEYSKLMMSAKERDIRCLVMADPMMMVFCKAPGELGADAVAGSMQRFGVPMAFGGPHAGFLGVKDEFRRQLPGRIIGLSKDTAGREVYRMALQTREQHIRREKATSNICTAQVLLAVLATFYALWHGPDGLRAIARRIHEMAVRLSDSLEALNFENRNANFFDTIRISNPPEDLQKKSIAAGFNFRHISNNEVCIALDETTTDEDLNKILALFSKKAEEPDKGILDAEQRIPAHLQRSSSLLLQPAFQAYHSEHAMQRYIRSLEEKDISLLHSMIPLGSCTMKLNANTEMIPMSWPAFSTPHPFAPTDQNPGYLKLIRDLENWLAKLTGFDAVSLQPNSGAQGELAGLLTIRAWQKAQGEGSRHVVLIPSSAHGTNPASAVMAGTKVVVIACDDHGNIDVDDLRKKSTEYSKDLCALMVTYPSTHGVFEEEIREICNIVHDAGGQVYMDGANLNAQVGWTSPGFIGADVCHLNLHKSFAIPHGGGGPGVGPIAVAKHLKKHLPGHPFSKSEESASGAVSAAPFGSAGIFPISWTYLRLMGSEGLQAATARAILNANYLMERLKTAYPILYTGKSGRCAHEFILDCRAFKKTAGIEVEDIAKRLMDYGFHAPTVSFPVVGTLMIEPTESEPLEELDRFAEALLQIRREVAAIETDKSLQKDNLLKNAPHPAEDLLASEWKHGYSREEAAYPLSWVRKRKYWPPVGRADNAYGDRNLVCTCAPVESYS